MDREAAEERLRDLRAEIESTVAPIRRRLASAQRDSGGDVAAADQHPADVATDTESRELDVSQLAMFEARLARVDRAMTRLRDGSYGRCVVCGQAIPGERLELVPDTPYCVKDAQRAQSRAQ